MQFNPHPPLSALPAVLLLLAVATEGIALFRDKIFFRRFALTCLLFCAAFVPLTYYSGYYAAEFASITFRVDESVIETHQSFAQLVLIGVFLTLLFRLLESKAIETNTAAKLRKVYSVLLFLTFSLCIYTATLGGNLVFGHGAGVFAEPSQIKSK